MAVTVDPDAERLMALSSALLRERNVVRRQRTQIWALVTVLRAERAASAALVDLLNSVLGDLDG